MKSPARSVEEVSHSRPSHDEADAAAVTAVLRSQMTATGRAAADFAELLRAEFGGRYAATTASGTLALFSALAALDVAPGDEVILPTYVCAEVVDAVRYAGATPALCDIDEETYAPSAATVAAARTSRSRVVIVPHLFGIPAAVDEIVTGDLPVIEDLAQGLGARLHDRAVGTWGALCIMSFKAIKVVSTGEGGAIVIRDGEAAQRLRSRHERIDATRPSFDFPMSDVTASLGRSQWTRLASFLDRRRALAARYRAGLADLADRGVVLPVDRPGHAWFRFPLTLPPGVEPGYLRHAMAAAGVQVRQPVDALLHRALRLPAARFPAAERAFASTLSLPIYPALDDEAQDHVIEAFRTIVETHSP